MMRVVALSLLFFGGVIAVGYGLHVYSVRQALEFRQAQAERITYYRFKASYVVNQTEEHIDFDYVVACGVVETTYKDGDRSLDTLGVNPKTFIKATKDGHAIQVWTPEACNGEIKNGLIPPDLFPFAIFYDDVNDMGFGWGYASQDAYDGARAQMSFEGRATIEAATYTDWKAWRAEAEAEFKPIGKILSPWGYSYEDDGNETGIAVGCAYYKKLPILDPNTKKIVTDEWIKRGRPEFWAYNEALKNRLDPSPVTWAGIKHYNLGALIPRTRNGGIGTIPMFAKHELESLKYKYVYTVEPIAVYPLLPPWLVRENETSVTALSNAVMIDTDRRYLGFAACGTHVEDQLHFARRQYTRSLLVNRDRSKNADKYQFAVNNVIIDNYYTNGLYFPYFIFHDNDYFMTWEGNEPQGLF